ncbi:acyl-CoA desaturase [bacterium]|jgi:stearoyl-CoA desaturase (delta-9 desaturase)|nr:acyl-CoA desaturase [bacterium]|tara:strand:- start:11 stop:937 length:927 start_codon:yes stop_codon:yes gene_type:complete
MLSLAKPISRWFDTSSVDAVSETELDRVDLARVLPFILLHASALFVFWVGWSPVSVGVAITAYWVRMFAVTGFYHRYFSHRSYKTSRLAQFGFALVGATSVQRGPLWWAAHHRNHHRHSDSKLDPHSPNHGGLLWSHMLWLTTRRNFTTDTAAVPDLAQFPELRFLDRFDILVPTVFAAALLALGSWLPDSFGTSGWQMVVWGFVISTLALFHGTCTINSLAHRFGNRRYATNDDSRNNLFLALLTLGEGWHNNHHHCPGAVRQGFYWWEIDITYCGLKLLSWLGLIWDLNPVPERAYAKQSSRSIPR